MLPARLVQSIPAKIVSCLYTCLHIVIAKGWSTGELVEVIKTACLEKMRLNAVGTASGDGL